MNSLPIIGAILQNPKQLGAVLEHIRPEMLDSIKAQKTLRAMILMDISGEPIDLVSLSNRLRPDVDGLWLTTCTENAIPSNAGHYAKEQYEYWAKRELKSMVGRITFDGSVNDNLAELTSIIGDFEENFATKKKQTAEAGQITERYLRYIDDIKNKKVKTIPCTMPGLADPYDNAKSIIPFYIGGLYVVISSYSSVGKSAMLTNIAATAAHDGANVVIISNEMGQFGYAERFAAYNTDIPYGHIMTNLLSEHQREAIVGGLLKFSEMPIKIFDKVRGVNEVKAILKKLSYHQKTDIVLVDYLQNMVDKGQDVKAQLDTASNGLMKLAQDYDLTIIAASQIDNASAKGQNLNANFMAPKGSGDIAADADIFIELNRDALSQDDTKRRTLERVCKKNRPFGRVGKREIYFNKSFSRITNEMEG